MTRNKLAVGLAIAAVAIAQAAQAGIINEYKYNGTNNVVVFTLSAWNDAPSGAVKIKDNEAWNSGTWTVPTGVTSVQVLVVGGGGGGAGLSGGGGGGGTYTNNSYGVTPGSSMQVTVGAGGVGTVNEGTGNNGSLSQFGSQLIAYGGYYGQQYHDNAPQGDQGRYSFDGGSTTYAGHVAYHAPGGGGNWTSGAGAGADGTSGNNENGAIGLQSAITGENKYYAGGGASVFGTQGGLGGGGYGGGTPQSGTPNTGGGAGGGAFAPIGANGGSGIVIVSYAIPEPGSLTLLGLLGGALLLRRKLRKA